MPELRYSVPTREWVILATERAKRPKDFIKARKESVPLPEYKENCPFCPGNERLTPEENFRIGDERGWRVRCVPNLFGALSATEKADRRAEGMHISMGGFGRHEVIIENPRHNACLPLMSDGEVEEVIRAYKDRYLAIQATPGIESIIIFKNHGPGAGTSLEHPHSQLIATPIVPPHIRSRIESAVEYFDTAGCCVFCKMIKEELKAKARVVLESEHFVSFLPYAGVSPFLIQIYPKRHASSFADINEAETGDLARNLKDILRRLYYGLDNPDFNYTIRCLPAQERAAEYFHWFLSIIPRLSQPAGFELGSGMFINTALPEESAEFLRQVKMP